MDKDCLLKLLNCTGEDEDRLFGEAASSRNQTLGNFVYLRGLIEISNVCRKDCLYCGIRKSNQQLQRYQLSDREILDAAIYAWQHNYGSVVLQGGERTDIAYISRIERLIGEIIRFTEGQLRITLSLGEQASSTYQRWFDKGATRYLLRIETSNENLYHKIHPRDSLHNFKARLRCLESLQKCGYRTGSGIMIGLPFQTLEDLAEDLLFLQSIHIDMVGMGPYLEHPDTPLYQYRLLLPSLKERLQLGLKMVAALRLLMPSINIAATTALQAIDPLGREKALLAGANVIMPNITPYSQRKNYKLYQNKPLSEESSETSLHQLIQNVRESGCEIALGQWGDPVLGSGGRR